MENTTDDIAARILHSGSDGTDIASLAAKVRHLNETFIESVDTINAGNKKLLKEHLLKVEKALNNLNEQLLYNENVIKHLVCVLTTNPNNQDAYQAAWSDARQVFLEFLKKNASTN